MEISTDLAVDNLLVEARCPYCGEKRTITAGSLLVNTSPEKKEETTDSTQTSDENLSFMDFSQEGNTTKTDYDSSDESISTDMFDA